MSKRRTRKSKTQSSKKQALENLRQTRNKMEADHKELFEALKTHIQNNKQNMASFMQRPPSTEPIDKQKNREMLERFLDISESDFLKDYIRKSLS